MTSSLRSPKQARALRTRAAVLEAGATEFSKKGYAATTSKSIAKRAGVATGTFYQYFADKDALLLEVACGRMARMGAASLDSLETDTTTTDDLREHVRERVTAIVAMVTWYHREDPGLHAVLTERRHADPELDELTSASELALVERLASLLERWGHAADARATAFVLFGMVEGSVHAHVLGTPMITDDEFFDALVHAVMLVALPPTPATTTPTRGAG